MVDAVASAEREPSSPAHPILELRNVVKTYRVRNRPVRAVAGVNMEIWPGETVGLIGESGSGKSTIGKIALGMTIPDSGEALLDGVGWQRRAATNRLQRSKISIVFQDPGLALNPRLTTRQSIAEPIRIHLPTLSSAEQEARIRRLVQRVQLPESVLERFPGQLSGGQQQRVGIAHAIATDAKFVVLDEPTASLDASVGAEVLSMLSDIQSQQSTAYLLISHDISTIRRLAERLFVLYRGVVVESGRTEDVLRSPRHPYTRALISAVLTARPQDGRSWYRLSGVPTVDDANDGCVLYGRCPEGDAGCVGARVSLRSLADGREVACVKSNELFAEPARIDFGDEAILAKTVLDE